MEYRSTSAGQHIGGAIVAGAEYGSGIEIGVNSSGNAPVIIPVGDETNKGLTVVGKGTGTVTLGNSSSPVAISGTAKVGSSGTALAEIRRFTVQFTAPTLSSGFAAGASAAESTYTVAGVSTGTLLVFTPTNPINALYNVRARCSTADELTLCFSHNGISTLGSGESTNRGVLIQFR